MTTTKSLEQQIRDITIPQIDIHNHVMHTISNRNRRVNFKLVLASITIILLVGTGFASLQFIKLYNENGEEWVNIMPYNQQQPRSTTDTNIINEYLSLINEGEAIAVYNPINNVGQVVSVKTKPIEYKQWNDLIDVVGNSFPLPPVLDASYSFNSGSISLTAAMPDNEKLIQDSIAAGNKITYEKLDVENDIAFISLSIIKDNNEYTISMFNGQLWDTVYTDLLSSPNLKIINVLGTDCMVVINSDESKAMWRSSVEHGDVFYSISTTNTTEQVAHDISNLLSMLVTNK